MATIPVVRQWAVQARPRTAVVRGALRASQRPLSGGAGAFALHTMRWSSSSSPSPSTPPPDAPPFPFPPEPPAYRTIYKNKKVWPPDFSQLSPQEQLRFEKRYKRRVALKSARPRWIKFVKLAQLFTITFVVIYCVLFMKWEHGPNPFDGFRKWFWESLGLLDSGPKAAVTIPKSEEGKGSSGAASEQKTAAK